MNFIKKLFVNLDAKRRTTSLKSFMRSLGTQSGYALDAEKVHSFFADGRYDIYFALKEKVAQLETESDKMKSELWQACVLRRIEPCEDLELELCCTGSRLIFKNVDTFHKECNIQLKWKGTSWRISNGDAGDTFEFKHCTFVERFDKINTLEEHNRNQTRDDKVKDAEWWLIIDLNFIAYQLRELKKIIRNWEFEKV